MDQGGDKRREPTMADLEAFERLLRDSLQGESRPVEPKLAQSDPAIPVEAPGPHAPRGHDALAELSRLVEAPLDLKIPGMPATEKAVQQMHAVVGPPPVEDKSFVIPPPPTLPDSLSLDEFEAELRRFEAAPATNTSATFQEFPVPDPLPATQYQAADRIEPVLQPVVPYDQAAAPQPQAYDDWQPEPPQAPYDQQAAYEAEEAAYAQAAAVAAAAAAAAAARQRRSRVILYSLGGLAALGATALGASFLFSGKSAKPTAQRDVPVVVAKTDPTKEKPANPGGVEIPDQNKQILSPKAAVETKPAQVVTTTEQPLDLNQVARRDGVRVITPSPFQAGAQPAGEPSATPPAAGEPRRVQSVRLNDPVNPASTTPSAPANVPPAGSSTPSGSPGIGAGSIAAIAAANLARPGAAQPSAAAPSVTPPPAAQPRVSAVVPAPSTPAVAPPQPVKVESRPVTAATRPEAAPSVPSVPRQPPAARASNAPLNLTNPQPQRTAAATAPSAAAPRPAAASTGGSGFAVQLASRPTESDARGAVGTLSSRYAGPLGGRAATVVSGQANGQTVYRVRVNGFSQSDAAQACEKIKASGGGCFVTRQ